VLGTCDPSRWQPAWLDHRRCLDAAFALQPEIERFDVPWGPGPFPAFLIRGRTDRVLVVQNGLSAALSDTLMTGVLDAVARGWSAVAFDGPGQGATRVVDGVGPVDDWAAVIATVLDAVAARAEAARVALFGVGDGATLALQAAARDPRVVALVCDPGVIRPLDRALAQLPPGLVTSWREHDDEAMRFQRLVVAASHDPSVAFTIAKLTEPWPDQTLWHVLTRLAAWDVTPLLDDVVVPVLVCEPDPDVADPGQAAELAMALGGRATRLPFEAGTARPNKIFGWLEQVVPDSG
jgi:pimeloyl-ACP methyl ester carboxylesterase